MIDRLIGAGIVIVLAIGGFVWFKNKLAENQRLKDAIAVHEQAAAENEQAYKDLEDAKARSDKAAAAARARETKARQEAETFRGNLNARVQSDPVAKAWASVPVPGAVAECVRNPGACSGAAGGTDRAAGMDVRPNTGSASAGPSPKP